MEKTSKKFLKYIGKTVATIACPPLGLALWPKSEAGKSLGLIAGLGLSLLISGKVVCNSLINYKHEIYDNLTLVKTDGSSANRFMLEAIASPLALYFDSRYSTVLNDEESAIGKDVIKLTNGQYVLNFDYKRKFGGDKKSVDEVKKRLSEYLDKGDLLKAREARKDLEEKIHAYENTKRAFQGVVDNMNSELKELENIRGK